MSHLILSIKLVSHAGRKGMKRYYALILTKDNRVQLIRELDGFSVLADASVRTEFGTDL